MNSTGFTLQDTLDPDLQETFAVTPRAAGATGAPMPISSYRVVAGSTGLSYEYWEALYRLTSEEHGRLGQLTDAIYDLREKMTEITDQLANAR